MINLKTILIDDERLAREELKSLLKKHEIINIISEAKNGKEAISQINELKPDLIFLDINMPGVSGFDLLKSLHEIPMVVFVTAYDEHAVKAFEYDALDYILKPVDPERLNETIQKIKSRYETENLEIDLAQKNQHALSYEDSVFIKDGEKCWFIPMTQIRMLESEGNYVRVYFEQFKPLLLGSLGSFEAKLDNRYFFRANRKFIINTQWIKQIENWFNSGLMITLKTDEKIEISRRQALKFKTIWSL